MGMTAAERSRRRRERLSQHNIKEMRLELSASERELFKRCAVIEYNSVAEFIVLEALKYAEQHGIHIADINVSAVSEVSANRP